MESWKEKYKNLPYKVRWRIDQRVKARKKRRKIIKTIIRGTWNLMIAAAFMGMFLCMAAIESHPVRCGAIMLGCAAYLAIVSHIEEKWKAEIEEEENKIIPFPIKKTGETKIS